MSRILGLAPGSVNTPSARARPAAYYYYKGHRPTTVGKGWVQHGFSTVEVGGPEKFRLDELVRLDLAARKDPREVAADPDARYYGVNLSERTLVPDDGARLSETRFETWLSQSASQSPKTKSAAP